MDNPAVERGAKHRFSFKRVLTTSVAAAAIFLFGVGIGNGRIAIGPDAVYRKSQQQNLPANLDYSSVEKLYDTLRASYDGKLDQQKLLDGLRSGLARSANDPYTEYLDAEAAKQFSSDLSGTFTGIGAELGKDGSNVIIVAPISGFPAEKAGLKPRDIITEINGQTAYDLSISEAVQKIRGPKDTVVKLKVIRDNKEALDFSITRKEITIPSVTTKTLEGNIGYIRIARFSDDTVRLTRKAAEDFKQANVKGVVLDVRSNPGGLLEAAVGVSGIWLPEGKTVLSERRGDEVVRTFKSQGPTTLKGIPTVVLIDAGSASASEIVAGALKDNDAATLLGEKSFGKGSVQQLEDLRDGSMLKVTIARWFTPAGKNIDKAGIKPDKEVKITDEDAKAGKDTQLDAAAAQLKQ